MRRGRGDKDEYALIIKIKPMMKEPCENSKSKLKVLHDIDSLEHIHHLDDDFNYATPSATRANMQRVLNITYHTKSPL